MTCPGIALTRSGGAAGVPRHDLHQREGLRHAVPEIKKALCRLFLQSAFSMYSRLPGSTFSCILPFPGQPRVISQRNHPGPAGRMEIGVYSDTPNGENVTCMAISDGEAYSSRSIGPQLLEPIPVWNASTHRMTESLFSSSKLCFFTVSSSCV